MADFNININAQVIEENNELGENVTKGQLVYLGTDSKYYLTNASQKAKSTTEIKIALEDGITGDLIRMLVYGYYEFSTPFLIPGSRYNLSITNGEITTQVYTGTNNIIRYMGTGYSDTIFLFNPDQTFINDNARRVNDVPINIEHTHVPGDITGLDQHIIDVVEPLIEAQEKDFYEHNQPISDVTWFVEHNLDKYPSVTVIDELGNNIEGEIIYTDSNNLTINFNFPIQGKAYIN